ncbi:MAG TPA: NAD(P)-dependent alcohol dehydrogenase, partial [Acidimicrobiia bacterium]
MRAVVYDRYGPPEVLRLDEVPTPTPRPTQVLIRVAATSLNRSDWECLVGSPIYGRIGGLRTPGRPILGSDVAGEVVAAGAEVTLFQPGDEVYGEIPMGGLAEFAVAEESALAIKPAGLSFAEASTLPQAGAIAQQGMAGVERGNRVLINGAGGGSGSFAIQIAKLVGAHVVAVDNGGKLDFMRSVGADEVIDYRVQDFTDLEPSDLVLDLVAQRSVAACRRAVVHGGRYRCVGGPVPTLLAMVTIGPIVGRLTGRRLGLLMVRPGPASFAPLGERCAAGEIRIHIDETHQLDDAALALARVGEDRALGKVVVV